MSDDSQKPPQAPETPTGEGEPEPNTEHRSASTGRSPGQILRDAREAKGMSVEELTGHTMLSRSTVQALENDDYATLSQPVFVRGYYRKCAKVLDVSENEIMAAYSARTGVEGPKPASPAQVDVVPHDVTPGNRRAVGFILLMVAAVALAALLWSFNNEDTLDGGDVSVENSAAVAGSEDSTAGGFDDEFQSPDLSAPNPDASVAASDTTQPSVNDPAAPGGGDPAPGAAPSSAPAAEQAEAEAGAAAEQATPGLRMRFIQRSWVDIKNAAGKRVLGGIVPADTDRTFPADEGPYSVGLGYTPGVEVYVNGELLDLTSQTNSDNTARFSVDLSQ